MDRGSLRSVPLRPPGDVDPALAASVVAERLPGLDETARRALALVELLGVERPRAAGELGMSPEALGELLWRARKALRRSVFPLSASGWCERAERLLSDSLDGELAERDAARLRAHLAHCERCDEHERRLAQARDGLVRAVVERVAPAPEVAPAADAEPSPAELRVVPEEDRAPELVALAPPVEEAEPEPPAAEPAAPAPDLVVVEPEPRAVPAEVFEWTESEPVAAAPEPVAAEPEPVAPAPEPAAVAPQTAAALARVAVPERLAVVGLTQGNAAWTALYVVAVVLAVASIALTVLAAAGGLERVF